MVLLRLTEGEEERRWWKKERKKEDAGRFGGAQGEAGLVRF